MMITAFKPASGSSSTTTVAYVHTDHLSGSNAITNDDAQVIQVVDYYPYGNLRLNTQYANFNIKKKFTNHDFDNSTGLSYAGARYQTGVQGRWISQDPASRDNPMQFVTDPQQLNGYSYGRNNPLILVDPTGEKVEIFSKAIEANSLGTHVFLLVTPDNSGDFSGMSGNWTVGAYAGDNGNLMKYINADSDRAVVDQGYSVSPDVGYMKQRTEVQRPGSVTDTEFINRIMGGYNAYGDDAKYDAFARKGYNSNNFVTGLLTNSGAQLPWNGNAKGIDPGYGQAIPNNYTKANGQMAPSGLGAASSYAGQQGSQASSAAFQSALRSLQGALTKLSNALNSLRSR